MAVGGVSLPLILRNVVDRRPVEGATKAKQEKPVAQALRVRHGRRRSHSDGAVINQTGRKHRDVFGRILAKKSSVTQEQ